MPFSADGDVTAEDVRQREAVLQAWRAGFARVEVPGNRVVEEVIRNNVRDIASFPMLDGPRDEWLALQAGVPLYPAFFGRDGVTAGWQAGYVDQGEALAAALTKLGRLQSDRVDDWRDEEPGRIPYQIRRGPLARLDLNPYSGYYADFASPLMFVISLANLWAWTGDRRHVRAPLGHRAAHPRVGAHAAATATATAISSTRRNRARAPRTRAGRTAATRSSTTTARRCRRRSPPASCRPTGISPSSSWACCPGSWTCPATPAPTPRARRR